MFTASDAKEVYNVKFYKSCRAGMVGHSIFRDFPLKYLKKEYRPKLALHVGTFLQFHAEGGLQTLLHHKPWLNTVIFMLGDNDLDAIDDTEEYYRDVTYTFMNSGQVLLTHGIRPFFVPFQNRNKPRRANYDDLRTRTNYQMADHFSRTFGYPAMVESLGYTNRTLAEDGIHLTNQDYLDVAREINTHLDRYRLTPFNRQRQLIRHETYLTRHREFEVDTELRDMGSNSDDRRTQMVGLERGDMRGLVEEFVDEARLLGEGITNEGMEEVSLAEEAMLLGEVVPTEGLEGAVGGSNDNGENGGNRQDSGLGFSLEQGTHGRGNTNGTQGEVSGHPDTTTEKADQNNNDTLGRGQRPRTRAYRRPYGRILGRGSKEKNE